MPKIHIDKSILIDKKPGEVFGKLNDFNHWKAWSPWIITDPKTSVNVREDGKYYDWDGEITGVGNMTVLQERVNEEIHYDLTFLKPWKSTAKVSFKLIPKGDGTEVHWLMDSKLPFFMFWMKKMMTTFVGMDYDRGLMMLKEYVEEDSVSSKLDFKGVDHFNGCKYVGLKTDCTIEAIPQHMKADYEKLMEYMMNNHKEKVSGPGMSIYHKWSPVKNTASYTASIQVSEVPADLPSGFISGEVPATKVHSISSTGPYRYTGNVWSAQYARQRAKKFKLNKRVHPMEIYHNSPTDTPERELVTEVLMPIQ